MVSDSAVAALQSVLNRAHGLTTGQKFVGAVGTIVSTVLTVRTIQGLGSPHLSDKKSSMQVHPCFA